MVIWYDDLLYINKQISYSDISSEGLIGKMQIETIMVKNNLQRRALEYKYKFQGFFWV